MMHACGLLNDNLKAHMRFPNQALSVKLAWTKNCLEERDAPWQTMLGANHYFCVLINVGLWLEVSLGFPGGALNPYVFGLSRNMEIPAGGMKSKGWAQDQCREYFKDAPFDNEKGPLGTHSLRKYGSTYCRNNGVSREDTNTHGRWKTKSQAAAVSDHYDATELPFVDTRVAAVLCVVWVVHATM
jgi:hypothetical protein